MFKIEENATKNNETGLKEGGVIKMSTTVLHSRAAPTLKYLPAIENNVDSFQGAFSFCRWYFNVINVFTMQIGHDSATQRG